MWLTSFIQSKPKRTPEIRKIVKDSRFMESPEVLTTCNFLYLSRFLGLVSWATSKFRWQSVGEGDVFNGADAEEHGRRNGRPKKIENHGTNAEHKCASAEAKSLTSVVVVIPRIYSRREVDANSKIGVLICVESKSRGCRVGLFEVKGGVCPSRS